jgi:hypothetical protein
MSGLQAIATYFRTLSRDERELIELRNMQSARRSNLEEAHRQTQVNQVVTVLTEVIDVDAEAPVVDQVVDGLQQILAPVSTNIQSVTMPARNKNGRPANWADIADHFRVFKKVRSTMKLFNLAAMKPCAKYWSTILYRWVADIEKGRTIFVKPSRSPCYGVIIEPCRPS